MDRFFPSHPLLQEARNASRIHHGQQCRPLMVICETVNRCNNNCVICAYAHMSRPKQVMPLDLFEKVLADYVDMGGGRLSLTPDVGEVFLDPLLSERIRLVRQFDKITGLSVVTNAAMAHLYDDSALSRIVNGFDRIYISVYGIDEEEHAAMTRRTNYALAVAGMGRVLNLLTNKAAARLGFRFLKRHSEHEIRRWMQLRLGGEWPFDQTLTYANWGGAVDTRQPLPFDAKWAPVTEHTGQCLMPLAALQIYSDGNVSYCPCPDFDNNAEFALGNVRQAPLAELYHCDKTRRLWDFAAYGTPDYCRRCTFFVPFSELARHPYLFDDPARFIGG